MNRVIFYFLYNFAHQSNFFDGLVVFFAVYFPYIVVILAGLFLFFYHKRWKELLLAFFTGGLALIISKVLKLLIHTDRPFVAISSVHNLFPESGYAFPSGHATFFFALAFAIFFYHKKAGYVFLTFALLISLARVIGGVHFPIDILGGMVIGWLVAYFVKSV